MCSLALRRMLGLAAMALLVGSSLGWCDGTVISSRSATRLPLEVNRPDLVIAAMQVGTPVGGTVYSALLIWVKVKNIGQATAARTKLTVFAMSLTEGDRSTPGTGTTDTPVLAPGASEWVVMPFIRTNVTVGIVGATVDPPTAEKPWGLVQEAEVIAGKPPPGREVNNTFACTFVLDYKLLVQYNNMWVH
ncbi:MAG: hypothetical protein WCP21_12355 [Armatimonadota bacterium]